MDVVYNHTLFIPWIPGYSGRCRGIITVCMRDGSVSNGSACGNDIASGAAMCASYLFNSVLYWAEGDTILTASALI